MRTNSIPLSRNDRRTARMQIRERRTLPIVKGGSRHLRWIAGIVAKHFHRASWHRAHAEAMALLYPARRTVLRLQTIVRQTARRAASTAQTMDTRAAKTMQIMQPQIVQPRIFIQRQQEPGRLQPVFFAVRELPRSSESKSSAGASAPSFRLARHTERTIVERLMLRGFGSGQASTSMQLLLASIEGPNLLRSQIRAEGEECSLPERVIRKLRRLEERPLHHARQAAVKRPAAPAQEGAPGVQRSRRGSYAEVEPSFEAHTPSRAAQQPTAVNVAQITDAVLQQLDRRLVAARERVGRI